MKPHSLRLDDVIFALNESRGILSDASARLGCARSSLYKFLRRSPQAMQVQLDWREKLIDQAEISLWQCLAEHQSWAVSLVLKSRNAAPRGWTDGEAADKRHTAILLQSAKDMHLSAVELIAGMEDLFSGLGTREPEAPGSYERKLADLKAQAAAWEQSLTRSWPQAPPPAAAPAPAPMTAPTVTSTGERPDDVSEAAMEAQLRDLIAMAKKRLGQ